MKKMQLMRIAVLCFVAAAGFYSCTKESVIEDAQNEAPTLQGMTCNHPQFEANTQGSGCSQGYTGSAWMITTSTRNHLSWTVGAECAGNYNFYGVPVKYGLYKRTASASGWDTYARMHEFTSLSTNMVYGGSPTNLPNSTKCVLFVQEVPSTVYPANLYRPTSDTYCTYYTSIGGSFYNASDAWCFTTGNGYGNACPTNEK